MEHWWWAGSGEDSFDIRNLAEFLALTGGRAGSGEDSFDIRKLSEFLALTNFLTTMDCTGHLIPENGYSTWFSYIVNYYTTHFWVPHFA